MLDEQAFKTYCDQSLNRLNRALSPVGEEHDFEADLNNGVLSIEFEEPRTKFVVSPQTPTRQVWVSAHSRSFKLDWDEGRQEFVLPGTNQSLNELIAEQIAKQIGEPVTL